MLKKIITIDPSQLEGLAAKVAGSFLFVLNAVRNLPRKNDEARDNSRLLYEEVNDMNSAKKKLKYYFRVHDKEELILISKLLTRRRFGARNISSSWVEFLNYDTFSEWAKTFKHQDFMIRVYFNANFKRDQFRKEVKEILPFWSCGNDNCSKEDCEYFMYNEKHKDIKGIEYLWRCILADEKYHHDEEDD